MSISLDDLPDSWRSAHLNSFWDDLEMIDEIDGNRSVPAGGLYLNDQVSVSKHEGCSPATYVQPVGRKPRILLYDPLNRSR